MSKNRHLFIIPVMFVWVSMYKNFKHSCFVLLFGITLSSGSVFAQGLDSTRDGFQLVDGVGVISFPDTPIGSSSELKFEFLWAGYETADRVINIEIGIEEGNVGSSEFLVTGGSCQGAIQLTIGESCTVIVEFSPTGGTEFRIAEVYVIGIAQHYQGEEPLLDGASYDIQGRGISPPPVRRPPLPTDMTISGDLNFETVNLAQLEPVVRRMSITNSSGVEDSRFEILNIVFPDNQAFSLLNDFTEEPFYSDGNVSTGFPDECRRYLFNGDSCSFDVVFYPSVGGDFSGLVSVEYWWEAYFDSENSPQLSDEFVTANVNANAIIERQESEFTFTPSSLAGVEGEFLTLSITRSGSLAELAQDAYIDFSVSDNIGSDVVVRHADEGGLTWVSGESGPRKILIELLSDSLTEGREAGSIGFSIAEVDQLQSLPISIAPPSPTSFRTRTISLVVEDALIDLGNVSFTNRTIDVKESDKKVVISVTRSDGATGPAKVHYTIIPGSAQQGIDYIVEGAYEGDLHWDDGVSGSQEIPIGISEDSVLDEGTENFTLTLSDAEGVQLIAPLTTTVRIADTTPIVDAGTFSFDSTLPAYDEDAGTVVLLVNRLVSTQGNVSVEYTFVDGSAVAGTDYRAESGTLNWVDGNNDPKPISIELLKDTDVEESETFQVVLSNPQAPAGSTVDIASNSASATVSILDSTHTGELRLEASNDQVLESDGEYSINVQRVNGADGAIAVNYEVVGISATPNGDFIPVTGTLSWDNGEQGNKSIVVRLIVDSDIEPEEEFLVRLLSTNPESTVSITVPEATITIVDDSPPPVGTVSFSGSSTVEVLEGDQVSLVLVRSGGSAGSVSVTVETTADSAQPDADYVPVNEAVGWQDGETGEKTVVVSILRDTLAEDDERFFIRLLNSIPEGVASGNTSIVVNIKNAIGNPGVFALSASEYSVREDESALEIIVSRVGGSEGDVMVKYETRNDSADEADYASIAGTFTWKDGESADQKFEIPITADARNNENTERLFIILSGTYPYGDAVQLGSPSQASVYIVNVPIIVPPEDGGTLSFQSQSVTVNEDAETVSVYVDRLNGSSGEVSVDYELQGNTAIPGVDFIADGGTLTWVDGDSESKVITISVKSDLLVEGVELFTVQLTNPRTSADNVLVSLAVGSIDISIADSTNLGSLQFAAVNGGTLLGENSGAVVIEVERIGGSDGAVSVDYILVDRGATVGSDVRVDGDDPLGGTLTWPANELGPQIIRLLLNADTEIEADEEFAIELVNPKPVDVNILGSTLVLTIENQAQSDESPARLINTTDTEIKGIPNQILDPIILTLDPGTDTNNFGTVEWRVVPDGAVQFLQGDPTEFGTVTQLDNNNQTSMQVRINFRGFIQIIASLPSVSTIDNANTRLRSDPPLVQINTGEVLIVIRSGFAVADGLNANQAETGGALDGACDQLTEDVDDGIELSAGQQDLLITCQQLQALESAGNTETLARVLDRLAPEEVFYFSDALVDTADIQITNIYSRINAIRNGNVSSDVLDVSTLRFNIVGESIPGFVVEAAQNTLTGGGASSDDLGIASRWGVFASGEISVGEVDGDGIQRNSDLRTSGLTLGVDYRLNAKVVIGVGLGVTANDADFTGGEGEASANGLSLSLYGTWYETDEGYADVVLDVGNHSYDMSRRIDLPLAGEILQFAEGSTKSNSVSLTVGAGRNFSAVGWDFGPYFRMSVISGSVDGYSESLSDSEIRGSGSLLDIGAHSVKSTRFSLGGQVSRVINTRRAVILPQFRIEIESEREDKKDPIEAVFQNDPTQTSLVVEGTKRDRSFVNLGIGSSFVFRNGKSAYVFYETRAQHDYVSQHSLKFGLRLEF